MKRAKSAQRKFMPASKTSTGLGASATVIVPVLPPRNPYQALARQRKAGVHDAGTRKRRRLDKKEVQKLQDG